MDKRIVVLSDVTHYSDIATERALELAKSLNMVPHIIHVKEPIAEPYFSALEEVRSKAIATYEDELQEKGRAFDLEPHCVTLDGKPVPETLLYAKDIDASLLVVPPLAYKRAKGEMPTFRSISHKFARATDRPLLLPRQANVPYRAALAMIDFSDYAKVGLNALLEIIPTDCTLHLLHCTEVPSFLMASETLALTGVDLSKIENDARAQAREKLESYLKEFDLDQRDVEIHISHGVPVEAAAHLISQHNIDIAAVGTHGRGAVMAVMLGSVAEGLLDLASCDVLIVPPASKTFNPH